MKSNQTSGNAGVPVPSDLPATLEVVDVKPTESGNRLAVTLTLHLELRDAEVFSLIEQLAGALLAGVREEP
jgi:hypothetical protein